MEAITVSFKGLILPCLVQLPVSHYKLVGLDAQL